MSNEKNTGLVSGPLLKFTVFNGKVISLNISAFPLPSEWFFTMIDEPINLEDKGFMYAELSLPETSGKGQFELKVSFTDENHFKGVMKFPKGFYWVDFAFEYDVTINLTGQRQ